MTYINDASRVRADVVRAVETRDSSGNVVLESFGIIFGEHWADIQPLSNTERVAGEQLKVKATHRIFPESHLGSSVNVHDFYRSAGQLYRIVGIYDFRDVIYYDALHDIGGIVDGSVVEKLFFSFNNVGPGVYTFGSGTFVTVPIFAQAPSVIGVATNDGGFYIESVTTTGFTLVDRGLGTSPLVTIYIWEIPVTSTDTGIWSFTGIGPGSYTFGTASLAGMPAGFSIAPYVYTQNNNDGDHYLTNLTATGFTITDKGIGPVPSISVLIIRK